MNTAYNFLKNYIPVRDALKTREEGDFLAASNHEQSVYYFNGMAREIWYMLDGNISLEGLCTKIVAKYDVTREQLEGDIVKLVRDLQHKKLIRVKEVRTHEEEL